jgi:NADPH:quinone reductase-like Zn-dependent oxidoreductase
VCFSLNIGIRNLSLQSMSISSSARFMPETMRTFRDIALPLFASRKLHALVDVELPMRELARAHGLIDARNHFGKIVLVN